MKIAFAGTPEFARSALAALLAADFPVALVLTQAASRGTNETVSLYQEVQVDNTP